MLFFGIAHFVLLMKHAARDDVAFQWNWTRYLEATFENTNVTINPAEDRVIVMDLRYLQKLPLLLSVTPHATIGMSDSDFRTLAKPRGAPSSERERDCHST